MKVEDNGIGITEERLKKVVTQIGKTTRKDRSDIQGQFGVGFLSYFQLSESFKMETKSRSTDESIVGTWSLDGFESDENSTYDTYGTRFTFETDIEDNQLEDWIRENAQYARCDVYLNGSQLERESIEPDTSAYVLKYEDEYIKATRSYDYGDKEYRTVLLDVPVSTSYDFNLRLKTEQPTVIDGPNKGEVVGKTIDENELHEDDVVTPKPTTSRDSLNSYGRFHDWVLVRLEEKRDEIEDSASKLDDDSINELGIDEHMISYVDFASNEYYEAEIRDDKLVVSGTDITIDDNPLFINNADNMFVRNPFESGKSRVFKVRKPRLRDNILYISSTIDRHIKSPNIKRILISLIISVFLSFIVVLNLKTSPYILISTLYCYYIIIRAYHSTYTVPVLRCHPRVRRVKSVFGS